MKFFTFEYNNNTKTTIIKIIQYIKFGAFTSTDHAIKLRLITIKLYLHCSNYEHCIVYSMVAILIGRC